MAPKGTEYTIFKPRIFVAAIGSVFPSLGLPLGMDWPSSWFRVRHTTEGCTITPSAGKDDITSDEAGGAIGVVPSGDSDITIGFTPLTPDLDLFSYLSNMQAKSDNAALNEQITFDLTGSPVATAGSVSIGLNGTLQNVAVAAGDTADTVAGKLAAASYTGYTVARTGTVVIFTKGTAGASTIAPSFTNGGTGVTLAVGSPSISRPFTPAHKRFALNPEGRQFMFGVEGEYSPGSLTEFGGVVRAFGYKVEQTNDVAINMRKTTDDAVLRLEAEVRCLTTTVTATQKAGTGMTETDDRFDMFFVPNTV